MEQILNCPVCGGSDYEKFLTPKDYLVSKNKFKISECKSCGFHFTNPIPSRDKIGEYYQSENYISHHTNKRGFINSLYVLIRKSTLQNKVSWVKKVTHGLHLLDIGSGTGHFLKVANDRGFQGVGIEPNENARAFAHRVNQVRSSPQEDLYNIEDNTFDVITMWHVLEHVYDLRKDLHVIHNILKPDGKLFIAVPNMESFDARHYKRFWAAYDVPRHLYHFRKIDLVRLLLDFGFELKKVIPMKYDAYYISMLSEKNRTRIPFLGFAIGFLSNLRAKRFGYSSQTYVFEKNKSKLSL